MFKKGYTPWNKKELIIYKNNNIELLMKKCSKCKREKVIDKFYKVKRNSDGLSCYCKLCQDEINKQYRKRIQRRNNRKKVVYINDYFLKNRKSLKQSKEHIRNRFKLREGYRHSKETKQKISKANSGENNHFSIDIYYGEDNPNWKGGITKYNPYCKEFTEDYKEYIRERDGNKCLNPDCYGQCNHLTLHIHHIDYNKMNCVPKNLITLCHSCNVKANFNREWHQSWYEAIMYRRYNS